MQAEIVRIEDIDKVIESYLTHELMMILDEDDAYDVARSTVDGIVHPYNAPFDSLLLTTRAAIMEEMWRSASNHIDTYTRDFVCRNLAIIFQWAYDLSEDCALSEARRIYDEYQKDEKWQKTLRDFCQTFSDVQD